MMVRAGLFATIFAVTTPLFAATFTFTYETGLGLLAGTVTGLRTSDPNIINVQSLSGVTFNGISRSLPFFGSYNGRFNPPFPLNGFATLTFDASANNIVACDTPGCEAAGFAFAPPGTRDIIPIYIGQRGLGDYSPVVSANWTLVGSAVPEPASWAMFVTGFGLSGSALRRQHERLAGG